LPKTDPNDKKTLQEVYLKCHLLQFGFTITAHTDKAAGMGHGQRLTHDGHITLGLTLSNGF